MDASRTATSNISASCAQGRVGRFRLKGASGISWAEILGVLPLRQAQGQDDGKNRQRQEQKQIPFGDDNQKAEAVSLRSIPHAPPQRTKGRPPGTPACRTMKLCVEDGAPSTLFFAMLCKKGWGRRLLAAAMRCML